MVIEVTVRTCKVILKARDDTLAKEIEESEMQALTCTLKCVDDKLFDLRRMQYFPSAKIFFKESRATTSSQREALLSSHQKYLQKVPVAQPGPPPRRTEQGEG